MDHIKTNKNYWDARVEEHFYSDFYDVASFIKGKSSLNSIELELLPDLKNKSVVHLQCHFGQDTIALNRLGANVTGIDFSSEAVLKARHLAEITESKAQFIESDIYSIPSHHNDKYDLVFASYGVIGWHPDADKWFNVASKLLKPGGEIIFAEFHPVVWMFDDNFNDITYSYFNKEDIIEELSGSYTDKNADIKAKSITWNHSLSDIFSALLNNGFVINQFKEFDYSPYNCFNNTVEIDKNKYQIKPLEGKIPMVYALRAKLK